MICEICGASNLPYDNMVICDTCNKAVCEHSYCYRTHRDNCSGALK